MRFRHALAARETSASRILGQAYSKRFGRILIASSSSTTRGTARIRTARIGGTGPIWPGTAPYKHLTATIAFSAVLMTSSMSGHRLGTKEIESASLLVEQIAEAA